MVPTHLMSYRETDGLWIPCVASVCFPCKSFYFQISYFVCCFIPLGLSCVHTPVITWKTMFCDVISCTVYSAQSCCKAAVVKISTLDCLIFLEYLFFFLLFYTASEFIFASLSYSKVWLLWNICWKHTVTCVPSLNSAVNVPYTPKPVCIMAWNDLSAILLLAKEMHPPTYKENVSFKILFLLVCICATLPHIIPHALILGTLADIAHTMVNVFVFVWRKNAYRPWK